MNLKLKRKIGIITCGFLISSVLFQAKDIKTVNASSNKQVKLGIDNLDDNLAIFDGKKVGLITNPSGMDSNFKSSIDVLYEKTNLTTLFAAEHGIRGNAQAGDNVGNEVDEVTGLPVHSLYGSTKKPTAEMLEDVDILAYDMQDVGARFYTYINTLAYAMEACAENDKTFVVFDRPNPVGGEVQGNLLDLNYSSFVGMYPIVQRYGMTVGEYAKFINEEFDINCNLEVVEMEGWTRDMYYDETGLDTWVMPSPNMPTLTTSIVYTGTCVFEGTNVSEGRGTTRPFELIGAPWIEPMSLSNALNSLELPGVKFRAASFTPTFSKYSAADTANYPTGKNQVCGGVQVYVTDRDSFNAVKTGYAMLYTIRDMYPDKFQYLSTNFIDKLTGNSYVREGKYTLEELFEIVDKESNEFKAKTEKYYIYEDSNNNEENINSIKLGIDNIEENLDIFKDKRVGLITNPSGMDSNFKSSIDVLYEKTNLTTLFAAEHGIRGYAQAGDTVGSEIDNITGLPVYSLYGSTKKPTAEMLEDVDILAYDMQDVGARFYTYINTLAYAMEACAENNKTFVVFDRPNPVSSEVQGNLLDTEYSSFVGMYPIVQRYGLTVGEYAQYINDKFDINCDLKVVKMSGWSQDMYYDETGLDTWVMPSPNMPTLDTAIVYTGTCIFEGTNVSEGRGTTRPFELIGAPWINAIDLANELNSLNLSGVKFRAASFTPQFSKYSASDTANYPTGKNQVCGGVQVYVTDRDSFNAVKTGYAMLYTIRDVYPDKFQYLSTNFIDKLTGNSYVREGKYTLEELFEIVDNESTEFQSHIEEYRIYLSALTINSVPIITANDKTIKLNENFDPLKDVTAYDEEDGDLTSSIEIIENTVDNSKIGEYVVNYSVSDSNGAISTKKISVTVIEEDKDDNNNGEDDNTTKPEESPKAEDSINKPDDNNDKTNNNSDKLPQTGSVMNNSLLLVVLSLFMICIGKLVLEKKSKKVVDKK
ncbi:exo-beta-N-acetylmuramidase NamZ domain-containing protein [Clostridium nigeriense]|uniref:exo-beta-N-acetylmuramidase NamZ domain-containing protein n=1 Tax=Clostridium nigeriense TaxID=1805470 RepID=UPI003D333526